jgi:Endonuclease/Exonuclease/phosphatase family
MRPLAFFLAAIVAASAGPPITLRVATFNASLNRPTQGQLAADLNGTTNAQAKKVAEILQRVRPDVVLINEFDVDPANPTLALTRFYGRYLRVSQNGQPILDYPFQYAAISNTGVPTGATAVADGDFDNNGAVVTGYSGSATDAVKDAYGNDCFGFGWFPGQYSFAVYSKYPIQTAAIRSFRLFKWKDMPGHVMPPGYYTASEQNIFRLSSKNHLDLPIEVKPGQIFHLLASHPTPPSFDGAEDRNGRRNHDEIRLWADYLNDASWITDDAGAPGGLSAAIGEQRFIILGDMNADPLDGDSYLGAINQLRNHPLVNSAANPASPGGTQQSALQGGPNTSHTGDPAHDTSDFGSAGNLRVDHVLPSKAGFSVTGSGVFWPLNTDPLFPLLYNTTPYTEANQMTDHRLVWLDLTMTPVISQSVRNLAIARAGGDIVLTWGTQDGVTYKVEWSTDLVAWQSVPAVPIVFDNLARTATATDTASANKRLYRIVVTLEQ